MKRLKYILPIAATSLLIACGGEEAIEETEESGDNVEVTDELVEDNSELEPQIVMDLDNESFKSKMEERPGLLIDVRTADEFAEGFIEGAINIDFTNGDFEAAIDTLDTTVPTYVYCAAGGRSGSARDMLKDNGFIEIYNLANGYGGWTE